MSTLFVVTDGNTGEKAGLKIISFQGLTRIHGQYTVIICAGNNYIQEINKLMPHMRCTR